MKYIPAFLLLFLGSGGGAYSDLLVNGDFEGSPFDSGWSNTTSATATTGIAPGSTTAARLGFNSSGNFQQNLPMPASDFTMEFYISLAGTNEARSFNLLMGTATGNNAVNLRVAGGTETPGSGGTLQAFNGASWSSLSPDDFFTANQTYRLQIAGQGWGTPAARYDLSWSDAGSATLDHTAAGLTFFQTAGHATGNPLNKVNFIRQATNFNSFLVDDVSIVAGVVPEPGSRVLFLSGALVLWNARRRSA